jgi:biopolymer transport protein ExbB
MQSANGGFGLAHFLSHLDAVGWGVLAVLVLLSVASWTASLLKLRELLRLRGQERAFLRNFADPVVRVAPLLRGADDPWRRILSRGAGAAARALAAPVGAMLRLGAPEDLVAAVLARAVQEEEELLGQGLATVATASAAAPFVGLFGTVWSIFHALAAIGSGGAAGLDKVAGPVGEALAMTGIGLAVAIPALLLYNLLGTLQRRLASRLEGFAQEVYVRMADGTLRFEDAP